MATKNFPFQFLIYESCSLISSLMFQEVSRHTLVLSFLFFLHLLLEYGFQEGIFHACKVIDLLQNQ